MYYFGKNMIQRLPKRNLASISTFTIAMLLQSGLSTDVMAQEPGLETTTPVNWQQFRIQPNRCGSRGTTEIQEPAVAWKYATGDIIESSPATWNGMVFIGGHSKRMHALDLASGDKLWTFVTGG